MQIESPRSAAAASAAVAYKQTVRAAVAPTPSEFRKLFEKTRPFAEEQPLRSWYYVVSNLVFIAAFLAVSASESLHLGVRIFGTALAGLGLMRLFIIFHDYAHGAILGNSTLAKPIMGFVGCFLLRSPYDWRRSHNFHHQNNTVFATASVGSFPIMTLEQYENASPGKQLQYRIIRHPLVILFGYVTCFVVESVKKLFFKDRTLKVQAFCALAVHGAFVGYCFSRSVSTGILTGILPLFISCMVGVYMFYIQHNFEGVQFLPDDEWDYGFAALNSSSYVKCGPFFRYFSGNIGYHHIHHLNHKIPFYRLPETMAAIPELQNPVTLRLTPRTIWRSLGLKLWDENEQRLVGYPTTH